MKTLLVAISVGILLWPAELISNSCIATKPVKISGALCGRVFDPLGAIVPNAGLRVTDDAGRVIADAHADSKGDFVFPHLSRGKYQLDTTSSGYRLYFSNFEIVKRDETVCSRPVTVELGIQTCSGEISKRRPKHFSVPH